MNGLRITLAAGVAAALACTIVPATANADEEKGLAVGIRVAYADALGNVDSQLEPPIRSSARPSRSGSTLAGASTATGTSGPSTSTCPPSRRRTAWATR